MTKTWKDIQFLDVYKDERKKDRIIGLSFPEHNGYLGLEPSVLTVLPPGDNVEFSLKNIRFNDDDVRYYVCSVYISGMEAFCKWASMHDREKIIVGGYHPTTFPDEFKRYAFKIVQGTCDSLLDTIKQEGQVVPGITSYRSLPRYDLWNPRNNQQIIPGKNPLDIVTSINTSQGCPYRCDFCCTPIIAPRLQSKPLEQVEKEMRYIRENYDPKFIFIRDENFPLQKDWRERLMQISFGSLNLKIYLFASANLITEEMAKTMKHYGVFMVCLGLEDVTETYKKNENLDKAIAILKKHKIMVYLSFIVDPLKVIGKEAGEIYYKKLMDRLYELKPEMVNGNFLMPFKGTALWDKYFAYVSPEDYKCYDSKTPFLIRNPVVRDKMRFFLFWYQWQYYTSNTYNNQVRKFFCGDTLHLRFLELRDKFKPMYEYLWNIRP